VFLAVGWSLKIGKCGGQIYDLVDVIAVMGGKIKHSRKTFLVLWRSKDNLAGLMLQGLSNTRSFASRAALTLNPSPTGLSLPTSFKKQGEIGAKFG
jgi:hypothetical protein